MPHLFDTNAFSALVHQRHGYQRLATLIDGLPLNDRLLSAITLSEIESMVAKARNPLEKFSKIRLVLAAFKVVDFGEAAALHAGQIRAFLEPRGQSIGPLDTLIAAHALSCGAIVVTDNVTEFERVPELKVVNWIRR